MPRHRNFSEKSRTPEETSALKILPRNRSRSPQHSSFEIKNSRDRTRSPPNQHSPIWKHFRESDMNQRKTLAREHRLKSPKSRSRSPQQSSVGDSEQDGYGKDKNRLRSLEKEHLRKSPRNRSRSPQQYIVRDRFPEIFEREHQRELQREESKSPPRSSPWQSFHQSFEGDKNRRKSREREHPRKSRSGRSKSPQNFPSQNPFQSDIKRLRSPDKTSRSRSSHDRFEDRFESDRNRLRRLDLECARSRSRSPTFYSAKRDYRDSFETGRNRKRSHERTFEKESHSKSQSNVDDWEKSTESFLKSIGVEVPAKTRRDEISTNLVASSSFDFLAPLPTNISLGPVKSSVSEIDDDHYRDSTRSLIQGRNRSPPGSFSRDSREKSRTRSRSRSPPDDRYHSAETKPGSSMSKCKEDLFWAALLCSNNKSPKRETPPRSFEHLTSSHTKQQLGEEEESVWVKLARQAHSEDEKRNHSAVSRAVPPPPPPPPILSKSLETTVKPKVQDDPVDPDNLKFGNYLLVCWDAVWWSETDEKTTHLCFLTGFISHGENFSTYLLPPTNTKSANNPFRVVRQRFHWFDAHKCNLTKSTAAVLVENALPLRKGLEKFLNYLETALSRVRPAYDGALLLSFNDENIRKLSKALELFPNLNQRFNKIVKGVGHLTSFINDRHLDKFSQKGSEEAGSQLSLDFASSILLGKKPSVNDAYERSQYVYEMLEKLLGTTPSFGNFFIKYIHPLTSKVFKAICSKKTEKELVQNFLPLTRFVSRGLSEQKEELVELGMYEKDDPDNFLANPEEIAATMIRGLVSANFTLDGMLETYKSQGLDTLELQLRTSFLTKNFVTHSRTVVEQSIRTTKLIVDFFRRNGKKSLEELHKETQMVLPTPANISLEDWFPFNQLFKDFYLHFGNGHPTSVLESEASTLASCFIAVGMTHDKLLEAYRTNDFFNDSLTCLLKEFFTSKSISVAQLKIFILNYLKKASEETKEEEIKAPDAEADLNEWAPYKHMYDQFVTMFKKFYTEQESILGGKLLISALLKEGLFFDALQQVFSSERALDKNNLSRNLRIRLNRSLQRSFPHFDKVPISIDDLTGFLCHYCQKNLSILPNEKKPDSSTKKTFSSHTTPTGERGFSRTTEKETNQNSLLTDCRAKLAALLPGKGDELQKFKQRFNSLKYALSHIESKMKPMVIMCGGTIDQLSEMTTHLQELLAYCGLSYIELKNLSKQGGAMLKYEIAEVLTGKNQLLPKGITPSSLSSMLLEYFNQN